MSAPRKRIANPLITLQPMNDGQISVMMTDSDTGEYVSDFTLSVDAARQMAKGLLTLSKSG